ncbi:hypothetical protein B0H13DRAFT_1984907 [Mycena leptocephala]|nr:hypothetical protein B0H13DRAFT_1984907 [Mycena leptocephala]
MSSSTEPLHTPPLYSAIRSPSPTGTAPISPMLVSPPLPSHSSSPSPFPHAAGFVSPTGYTPKVSFDTFENPVVSMFSFTLQVKSVGYACTRVFLCAAGPDESGREALDWSLESLVQDGDELVVCRGIDEDVFEKDHNSVWEEARQLMLQIQEKSLEYDPDQKALSLILEFIPGRINNTIDRLIALYRPDSVVIGTRGKKAWQGMAMMGKGGIGSVSKYCLTHSPVPVPIIVVRPERKVKKAMEKRHADPKRGTHFGVLTGGEEG